MGILPAAVEHGPAGTLRFPLLVKPGREFLERHVQNEGHLAEDPRVLVAIVPAASHNDLLAVTDHGGQEAPVLAGFVELLLRVDIGVVHQVV